MACQGYTPMNFSEDVAKPILKFNVFLVGVVLYGLLLAAALKLYDISNFWMSGAFHLLLCVIFIDAFLFVIGLITYFWNEWHGPRAEARVLAHEEYLKKLWERHDQLERERARALVCSYDSADDEDSKK